MHYIPAEVRRRGPVLLNQQCWCWGCDIRRTDGNLLIQHGFSRERAPEGERGSSMYRLWLSEARVVTLWGFGLWYGEPAHGGIYLSRVSWQPRLTGSAVPICPVWDLGKLPPMAEPVTEAEQASAIHLLAGALDWIADYEQWVVATIGLDYRQHCLLAWSKRTLRAELLAPIWQRLALRCAMRSQISQRWMDSARTRQCSTPQTPAASNHQS